MQRSTKFIRVLNIAKNAALKQSDSPDGGTHSITAIFIKFRLKQSEINRVVQGAEMNIDRPLGGKLRGFRFVDFPHYGHGDRRESMLMAAAQKLKYFKIDFVFYFKYNPNEYKPTDL